MIERKQLEKKTEMLHQILESEQIIDSLAATVQGTKTPNANGQTQTYIHEIASDVEHPVTDLADTLHWICPNATGLAAEAPKPAFPNDASYWHSTSDRSKESTLALCAINMYISVTLHTPYITLWADNRGSSVRAPSAALQ